MTAHIKSLSTLALCGFLMAAVGPAAAQHRDGFHPGAVITEFGPIAPVDPDMEIPEGTTLKHAFDTSQAADAGKLNRTLESAARFINMNAEAGIAPADIRVAVVVHGQASIDLLQDAAYGKRRDGATNPNLALIEALTNHGGRVILCGQSAAALTIAKSDLSSRVELALSAMTAHALLQQQGYTINPF